MLSRVITAVELAGEKILDVYHSHDFGLEIKEDNSPLTKADKYAHDILTEHLTALNVGPVLSEEGVALPWAIRQGWDQYWLIDPLDGTKEFIKRNDEFTVNVALIKNGEPVLGVVYAPAMAIMYFGSKKAGAFKKQGNSEPVLITPSPLPSDNKHWRIAGSRSHSSVDFDTFITCFDEPTVVSLGSSLKLCMVADGSADLYPRLTPTCEWDTAAAQAVVEAAGGVVLDWGTKKRLRYNTKASLLNPDFVVCAQVSDIWLKGE